MEHPWQDELGNYTIYISIYYYENGFKWIKTREYINDEVVYVIHSSDYEMCSLIGQCNEICGHYNSLE